MSIPDNYDPTDPMLPDDPDWRQQEENEHEHWLDELECQKVSESTNT